MKYKFSFNLIAITLLLLSTSLFGQEYNIHSAHLINLKIQKS